MDLTRELAVALEAADAADAITGARFRAADLAVESKADESPVSEADRAAEEAIRAVIGAAFPDDGILGEEFGEAAGAARRWIIDPIDATINYVRGVPVWATLIALEDADGISVGVVSSPGLCTRWWASRGAGAWRDGQRIAVSTVVGLDEAHLSVNALKTGHESPFGERVLELIRRGGRVRSFGDFWSFMLVAEGAIDVAVDPVAAVWDLAALKVIVDEAGGTMTDLRGKPVIDGGNAVATNGSLHAEVLGILE